MTNSQGLAGTTAGTTQISTVGKEGVGLTYRGYPVDVLANEASFEEVAYLLLYGELPNQTQLSEYIQTLISLRPLPDALKAMLELIPQSAHPMAMLRTVCSFLGTIEPENKERTQLTIANRLLAIFPGALLYWYHFQTHNKKISTDSDEESIAGYFLHLLKGEKPSSLTCAAMDASLILYAEHEFNASTFAARVTCATLADFYSAICSAIGALEGPLHGGANEAAMALISQYDSAEKAEQGIMAKLKAKDLIMGFGHRVYKEGDPRSPVIQAWAKKLSQQAQDGYLYPVSEQIEQVIWREKKLFPNLDFYSASTYHFCGSK